MAKSINDLAAELGISAKTVRKHYRAFVRANGGTIGQDTPGRGKRYSLNAGEYAKMRKIVSQRVQTEKAESEPENVVSE